MAAIRAETTKILTLPTLMLFTAVVVALSVGLQAISLSLYVDAIKGIDANGMIEIFAGQRAPAVAEITEQLIAGMFTVVPLVPVAGALIAGSEFRAGQIGVSLSATPSPARLLMAKAIATTAFTLALCLALAAVTSAMMLPAVRGWDPQILLSADVLAGYLRVAVIAVATTVMALGITMLARRALVAILVLAVLLAATISQLPARLSPTLDAALPISAARNLLFYATRDIAPPLTSGPVIAALVLAIWAAAALVIAMVAAKRRDAR